MNSILLTPTDFNRLLSEVKTYIDKANESRLVEKPLTVKEAASYLNMNVTTFYRKLKRGAIPSTLIHRNEGTVYLLPSELHQFIKRS